MTVIAGLGQRAAGDDAVGLHVIEELARRGVGGELTLLALRDPTGLVELIAEQRAVVIVDAVLGSPAGDVVAIDPAELSTRAVASSHGVGVTRAVDLGRVLARPEPGARVAIVGITIERPARLFGGLSPAVAAAVGPAADRVVACARLAAGDEALQRGTK